MRIRILLPVLALTLVACAPQPPHDDVVMISVVGTNDVHGQLSASDQYGGLVGISAYVNALREAREKDGGAVLVVDAGDMWQGTLESNLVEGASMVAAYNALGVAGAAIGNHEFDFGPAGPKPVPMSVDDDPRGALRQRANEATFPLLAANLVDTSTGQPVAWKNVRPSTMIEAAGVPIGIIGVTTVDSLRTTIAANTAGLAVTPLAEAITGQARKLRADGAAIVIVVAHAGGGCRNTAEPGEGAPCKLGGELAAVINALEPGLVDHVFGGHLDNVMAGEVNGVSVSMNRAKAESFGRVDFRLDRRSGRVLERRVFPPQPNAAHRPDRYENQPLVDVEGVAQVAREAAELAAHLESEPVGISLEAPFPLTQDVESALSNLVTEALLDSFDVDVAMHNVIGGLRAGLPAGELTYGDVYEMFPFDNVVTILGVTGADLRRVIAEQSKRRQRPGFAGMRVVVACDDEVLSVRMLRNDGREILDDDLVTLLVNDYLALGGDDILEPIMPDGGFALRYDRPRTRDALVDWLRTRGGSLDPANWQSHDAPKWTPRNIIPTNCSSPRL